MSDNRKKKDVHLTGALAAVLNEGSFSTVEQKLHSAKVQSQEQNPSPSIFSISSAETPHEKIIQIYPNECIPWQFANRPEIEMGNLEELAESIEKTGQLEPVLLRLNTGENKHLYKYEIIYGHRRWRACLLKKLKLKAIIREVNNQTAALYQEDENEKYSISDYAKAIHYQSLIDAGIFENEFQLSIKLNIQRNRFNDLMSYNRVPKELRECIPNFHLLAQRTAIKIASLAKDPKNIPILIQLAKDIGNKKITSTILEAKVEAIKSGSIPYSKKSTPILGRGGAEIFTVREDSNGAPCIVLHRAARRAINLEQLKEIIKSYVDDCIDKINKNT